MGRKKETDYYYFLQHGTHVEKKIQSVVKLEKEGMLTINMLERDTYLPRT
jgi:hypothetical protein